MAGTSERIGGIVRRGILLFSSIVPFPASGLVAAVAAASIAKIIDIHDRRISEVLSYELSLDHISYVEPNEEALLRFYARNPVYPELAIEFSPEIAAHDYDRLSLWYPYLYGTLVLKRQIPELLFHHEIAEKKYRDLAAKYEMLAHGYQQIQGNAELEDRVNQLGAQLMEVLNEVYEAAKDEIKNKENRLAFEIMDVIREIATI